MTKLNQAVLFQALMEKVKKDEARYHVPGHKGGHVFPAEGRDVYNAVLNIDLTELEGLDNLHDPHGVIKQAQEMAARQFGSDLTYFLVGGSTVGNLAMILGCIDKGDVVLVQRNSHQSVFHGLSLAEAQCVPLQPEVCSRFQVAQGINPDHFEHVLRRYPQAKACILTYPTYYGWAGAGQFETIVRIARQHGLMILVDEAHGAHFGQHKGVPPSALALGADISVQSTHKMLGSMTMTSMLHIRRGRVPVEDVEDYLHRLQSSSPSYPLMASLDLARMFLSRMTHSDWEKALAAVQHLREEIGASGSYKVSEGSPKERDPFKLVLQPTFSMNGYELQQALRQHGIEVELADPCNVCLTMSLVPNPEWDDRLLKALSAISAAYGHREGHAGTDSGKANMWPQVQPVPVAMKVYRAKEKEQVPLSQAIGRQAAEMITPYPPGIPLLIPGETISQGHISAISELQQAGVYFPGKQGAGRLQVSVVKKSAI
ncbi:arginine/lysine/ornithine decarboxylase [Caldalkalibacillus uzonensis]|uniref:Arginine/lysine/ornithine decarboxylase n=1 Tax=Caldalkalibacillus uzonensis TaxID=353224 RepID=A0ABU0CW23_9BACI|nr:aminotransferase class I/II-fold pyridoxal phosphate-dependent enzyme [Caldalkalibacillus uzonensis]MDQ0340616.1 arginine/lysine/ornithine decarboxylase [Caldalkalibacillus uzonensis]